MERPSAYIPMDRRQAILRNETIANDAQGAALFADVSGFTPLTEQLLQELGPQRGAEELTRHLNAVYDAIITELHQFGGSVISFSGDAITCWFDGDDGLRAVTCAQAMQQAMKQFTAVSTPAGSTVELAMKTAVSAGSARRFVVGNPGIQLIDVLAGVTLEHLAAAEKQAQKGEVVLTPHTLKKLNNKAEITEWRTDSYSGSRFGIVGTIKTVAPRTPWPAIRVGSFDETHSQPWLLPAIYDRLHGGRGEFLAELRPAVALFLRFSGIEYDADPEASHKLDQFVRSVQEILDRYESNLLQLTIGDKGSSLYAAFGAPLAHEDDPIRAVSAALELRDMARSLPFIDDVQIGISQGRLRTGAYGGTLRRTYGVLGDEVNTAARLMQAAQPEEILVSAIVQRGTADTFTWDSLPPLKVKGKAQPLTVFSLEGIKKQQTVRLQEPHYALPIVGRKAELATIHQIFDKVLQRSGQILAITGEAGIGKSRLVSEVIRLAGEKQMVGFGGECQSYGTHTSYLVWQRIWQGFFGLDLNSSLEEQIQVLSTQLEQINPTLVSRLPLLGTVLNLPIPDNDLTRTFDAKLRKASLESLLIDCLRDRTDNQPTLFILDDCHWLDPLSQDLIEAVSNAIADRPVLMVMAARHAGKEDAEALKIAHLPYATTIHLTEFTLPEAEELINLKLNQFLGQAEDVAAEFISRIVSRAEGNPFYIEELLNYLHDRHIDPNDAQALKKLDLPTSLHSLILSRIDQLTESQKSTIKVASVIGRLFRAAMLWGVYPQLGDEQQVKVDLEILSQLDLTPLDTPEPELAYLFKNIVTQEVAYESLPYATRAMLHELIGQYIERTYADSLNQYVDLLAHHYERSENEAKKRLYLFQAGEAAQANYANGAAMDYYERVLPLVSILEQADVLLKLGQVLELVGRWDEAFDRYELALDTAVQLNDSRMQARCQTTIGELYRKQGQFDDAFVWLERARQGFETLGDEAGVGQVLHFSGSLAAQQGDYATARDRYERSLIIRRSLDEKPQVASLLSNLAIVARYQGNYTAARFLNEESLEIRRELGDRRAIAVSLNNLGNVALDQKNYDEARAWLEEALTLQREVGDKSYIANSLNNLGNVIRALGEYETACELYKESLAISYELGDKWALAYLLEDMGALAALRGTPDRSLFLVGAAARLREEIGAPHSSVEAEKLEEILLPVRQSLTETEQAESRNRGYRTSLDEVAALAITLPD
ncbi:MAG: tetratricopeptide repeat protein [Anaerolineae bacterium]